ncbi:MAG: hypothetical protein ACHP9Z_08925, partial [Streptosporangiales bacterium]
IRDALAPQQRERFDAAMAGLGPVLSDIRARYAETYAAIGAEGIARRLETRPGGPSAGELAGLVERLFRPRERPSAA